MQVGSLVECVSAPSFDSMFLPKVGDILTVEDIIKSPVSGNIYLSFIEIQTGGKMHNGVYYPNNGYLVDYFREIQPPMDISELITETVPHEYA